ncbi:lipopolysaccharide assembly protein LapA domain-containing protein [Pseudomonas sp. zfem002]|uniref:lipopolysaccharide assembly protein LapA domain-containing protein n=1 Tax=Pseudomonas sp. zfem002 TaxID=3078197 RepID=UPI002927772C|nr:lipopolysaccharide assembly protein LapA domain-containing protein [Pseudomonas sp. zfem002]MDU9390831.1 lipopolysaccharide assembly protein LapA domain-containing protein [Pseudomonas sp. zfem002]
MLLLALFLLALVIGSVVLVLENHQAVTLVIFGWSMPSVPLAVLLLAALIFGLLVGPLLVLAGRLRKR